jgi:hypothetical protein
MNSISSEEKIDNSESEDEWLSFKDELADARSHDLNKVEEFFECCLRGEDSLHSIFNRVSALDLIQINNVWEVVIELVVCGCGFHEFDKNKQRALVCAVTSDLASVLAKPEFNLKIDVGWPNHDLQILYLSERPSTTKPPMCSVTLVSVADSRDHAEKLITALKELICGCNDGSACNWPSLVERIQEELLGLDGSDWDRTEIPFEVSVEIAPIVREARNDFLEFSSKEYPFRPPRRKVERVLILGGRDPHKNDFSKWVTGLQTLSAESPHRETSKMHGFSIMASSYSPIEYRWL